MVDPDATAMDPGAATSEPPSEFPCHRCGKPTGPGWVACAWCGTELTSASELANGTTLADGRYQLDGVIGRGGFGITYRGIDHRLERPIAVKEMFPESAVRRGETVVTAPADRVAFQAARERFIREARVLARFSHPGIVRVFEVFEENATAYLVMELLEGRTLVDVLRQHGRPLGSEDLVDLATRIAAALRPVHAAGVLHRDVNPSNVILTDHGRIVVIDFGLARDYVPEHTMGMTRVVTPGYAPIEQYRGEGHFGPFTDVYGLAATLYRLATGKVPVAALERSGGTDLIAPHRLNPDIPKDLSDAILDGLELEPSHRPGDLDAFLARMGVQGLPSGPRASVLETVPPPPPVAAATDAGETAVATEATRLVDDDPPVASDVPVPPPPSDHTVVDPAMASMGSSRPPVIDMTAAGQGLTMAGPVSSPTMFAPPPTEGSGAAVPARAVARPDGRGRRLVTVPLFLLAVAWGSAAPVPVTLLVVLVVLPLVATRGDSEAHRLRLDHGVATGWAERRMGPGVLSGPRLLGNVVIAALRCLPWALMGAAGMLAWYGLDRLDLSPAIGRGVLRAVGALTVGSILYANRRGTRRFRTGLGLDEIAESLSPTGGMNERVAVLWLVSVGLAAGALWLDPSAYPLG